MESTKKSDLLQPIIIVGHIIEEISFGFPVWATKYFGTTTTEWFLLSHLLLLPFIFLPLFLSAKKKYFVQMTIQTLMFTNAIFHILTTIVFKEYSPGLITSILLIIPFSFIFFNKFLRENQIEIKWTMLSLLIGTIFGLAVILSLYLDINISILSQKNPPSSTTLLPSETPTLTSTSFIVVAAGDIVCEPILLSPPCQHEQTAKLVADIHPRAILALGDLQYENGAYEKFTQFYDKSWGKFKDITYPAVGNHEYGTLDAEGYFKYFGDRAGDKSKGYYSYDIGDWHFIVLNSNCSEIGGCQKSSPQEKWLREDLATHPNKCTLAYWHHPRFSSGLHGSDKDYSDFWEDLYSYHADIVLNGHDHHYERFALQDPKGNADNRSGIREFVVGTGGRYLYTIKTVLLRSEIRNAQTHGVLKLTLHSESYEWEFVPIEGQSFTDSGSGKCH